MSGVKLLHVGTDEGESRLDRWLKKRLPDVTQGQIEKWCRTGQVRVDGGRAKACDAGRTGHGNAGAANPQGGRGGTGLA